ncbi:hypothetical protein BKA67DRAFT_538192 [Truncatella angustata]|uniref:Ribosomal protein bL31m N-terminal domain-containing protein n=1 Tax=Truncatella angustata TaxID=152316 RepID=A0A9P8UHU6_9PEZI|nr:uncharacterized protein BKA67DRAFT_538192 [Truncatella angustata]KAH6652378.1 hypothetical protein BKA67DRAFT_538192 [Truncatella angustata]KAH8205169.1 hypothetical protein TruAng_000734 [Truncatella angustata]
MATLRVPRRPTCVLSITSLTPQTSTTTSSVSRTSLAPSFLSAQTQQQTRNANLIRRHKRPYLFTQLVQLSDGSTYTMRTTSPYALYKSTKDTRNHLLWNPSERGLKNVEVDEAGKLAAFRERFGRTWDAPAVASEEDDSASSAEGGEGAAAGKSAREAAEQEDEDDFSLDDLIARHAVPVAEEKSKVFPGKK